MTTQVNAHGHKQTDTLCQTCNEPVDPFTIALLGKKAVHCARCETTWRIKTTAVPGGFRVWEETPSGNKRSERVWWNYCDVCDQGWFQHHQCSRCQTRISYAQHALCHPSGALKRPGEYGRLFIWFPQCQQCTAGCTFIQHTYYGSSSSEVRQCRECLHRYIQWHKERGCIRYIVHRPNYPIKLKIDRSKSLERSLGRTFYHEVVYTEKKDKGARVEVYVYHPLTHEKELLRIDEKYAQYFSSLIEAQEWVYAQMGGTLRTFWL